jgi:hypothetical protein
MEAAKIVHYNLGGGTKKTSDDYCILINSLFYAEQPNFNSFLKKIPALQHLNLGKHINITKHPATKNRPIWAHCLL